MSDEGNDENQNYASHADRLKAILKAHEPEINRLRASQGAGQKKPASKPSVSAAARRVETRRDREARQAELVEREREAQAAALFAEQEGEALQTRIVFSNRMFRSDDLRPQRREAQQTRQAAEEAGTYIPKKIRTPKASKETVRRTPVALSIMPDRGAFIAVEDPALLADILSSARAYRIGNRQSLFDHAKRIKAQAEAKGIEVSGRALRKSILAARPELPELAEGKTKFRTAEPKLVKIKPPKVEEVDSTEDERRTRRLQAAARRKALKDAGLLPLPKRSSKPNSSERTAKAASRISAQVDFDPVPETTPSDVRRQRREAANLQRQERTAAELRPLLECFVMISATGKSGAEDSRMSHLSDLLDQHPEDRVLAQELAKLLRLASNPTEAAKVLWGRETFPRIYTADDLQRDIDRRIRLGEFLEISTCLRVGRKPLAAATLLETVVAEFPESEEARLQLGLIRRPGEFTIEGSGDKKKIAQGHRKSIETLLPLIASPTHGEMAVASIVESKLALEDTQSALRWAEFRRPSPEDEPLGRLLTVAKFAHGLKTADIDLVEEALAHLPQHILKVGKKGIHLDFSPVVTTAQGLRADFRIAEYGFSPVVRLAEALLRRQRNEEAFLLFRDGDDGDDGDLLAKKDEKEPDADSRTDRLRGYLAGGISCLRKIDSSKRVAELQEHSGDSAAANRKIWDRGYRQAFCYLLQAYRVDRNHVELNAALRHVMAVTQNPAMARALKLEQDRQSKQADELLEKLRLGQEKAAEPVVVEVEGNRQREQAERPPHRATPTKRPRTSVPAIVS